MFLLKMIPVLQRTGLRLAYPHITPSSSAQGDIVAAKGWRQRDPSVSGTTVKDETKLRKECKETLKCVSDGLKENLKLVRNCVYRYDNMPLR